MGQFPNLPIDQFTGIFIGVRMAGRDLGSVDDAEILRLIEEDTEAAARVYQAMNAVPRELLVKQEVFK